MTLTTFERLETVFELGGRTVVVPVDALEELFTVLDVVVEVVDDVDRTIPFDVIIVELSVTVFISETVGSFGFGLSVNSDSFDSLSLTDTFDGKDSINGLAVVFAFFHHGLNIFFKIRLGAVSDDSK
jgi:hypothetical protein